MIVFTGLLLTVHMVAGGKPTFGFWATPELNTNATEWSSILTRKPHLKKPRQAGSSSQTLSPWLV